MNIYEQIEKCFQGKSVSLHFIHNKDKSITTLIEPKITDDDEKFNHPITFTTEPDKANDLLIEAFEKIASSTIPETLGGETIQGVKESAEQIEDEEGGSKKKTAKAKPAKKAPVVAKKKEPKPKVEKPKKEPKVAVVKPSKEETTHIAKIENAFSKLNDAISKKDLTLAKFWYDEIGKLLTDFDNRYDDQLVKASKDYTDLALESETPIVHGEGIDAQIKSSDTVITNSEIVSNEYNKPKVNLENPVSIEELQETKTEPSNDGDSLPMPN